jgi:Lar family restriction alleviation protein
MPRSRWKPCPFCGDRDLVVHHTTGQSWSPCFILCRTCLTRGPTWGNRRVAVRAWNRRKEADNG